MGILRRPINLRGIEKGITKFDGLLQQPCHLLPVRRRAVSMAHSHAAQTDGGYLQIRS